MLYKRQTHTPPSKAPLSSHRFEPSPIEKPLQVFEPCNGFVGTCQADMLRGANLDKLHDFNPPKRFRQGAEHRKEARLVGNEASFANQRPLSAMPTMTPLLTLTVQCCTNKKALLGSLPLACHAEAS